jgi:hypothetical protein
MRVSVNIRVKSNVSMVMSLVTTDVESSCVGVQLTLGFDHSRFWKRWQQPSGDDSEAGVIPLKPKWRHEEALNGHIFHSELGSIARSRYSSELAYGLDEISVCFFLRLFEICSEFLHSHCPKPT